MGITDVETIIFETRFRDVGVVDGFKSLKKTIKETTGNIYKTTDVLKQYKNVSETVYKKLVKSMDGFYHVGKTTFKGLEYMTDEFMKQNGIINKSGNYYTKGVKTTKKYGDTIKKITSNLKPFRMELLSVMFGAQMVSRSITGLFQPALQMAGVFELLGAGLAVFFLPAVMALLTPLINLVTWFMDLPEPIKLMVGALLGVVAAFFTFIGTEAAVKLFFAGFIQDAAKAGISIQTHLIDKMGQFASFAAATYGISLIFSGVKNFTEGNIIKGITDSMKGAAFLSLATGRGELGAALLVGGLVLEMLNVYINKETLTMTQVLTQIGQAGIAGWFMASSFGITGVAGAGLAIVACIAVQDIFFDEKTIMASINTFMGKHPILSMLAGAMIGGVGLKGGIVGGIVGGVAGLGYSLIQAPIHNFPTIPSGTIVPSGVTNNVTFGNINITTTTSSTGEPTIDVDIIMREVDRIVTQNLTSISRR